MKNMSIGSNRMYWEMVMQPVSVRKVLNTLIHLNSTYTVIKGDISWKGRQWPGWKIIFKSLWVWVILQSFLHCLHTVAMCKKSIATFNIQTIKWWFTKYEQGSSDDSSGAGVRQLQHYKVGKDGEEGAQHGAKLQERRKNKQISTLNSSLRYFLHLSIKTVSAIN